jgi:hypothetical protein
MCGPRGIPLKPGVDVSNIDKFGSYHTGKAILSFEDHPCKAIFVNDRPSENHMRMILCRLNSQFLNVAADGTYSNHCAINGVQSQYSVQLLEETLSENSPFLTEILIVCREIITILNRPRPLPFILILYLRLILILHFTLDHVMS